MWSQPTQKGEHRRNNDKAKRHKNNDSNKFCGLFLCHLRWWWRGKGVFVEGQPCLSKGQGWGRIMDLWRWKEPQQRRGETKALLFPWGNTWPRPWVCLLACFGLLNLEKELGYRSISSSWVFTDLHKGCRLLIGSSELHVRTFALLIAARPFLELRSGPGWPFLLQPTDTGCWASLEICACIWALMKTQAYGHSACEKNSTPVCLAAQLGKPEFLALTFVVMSPKIHRVS